MFRNLLSQFRQNVAAAKRDDHFGMPDFVRRAPHTFLMDNQFIIFSDPYSVLASAVLQALDGSSVLGICADSLPLDCDGTRLLSATDVYEVSRTSKSVVAIMIADEAVFDLGLRSIAMKAQLRTIEHHLIIRLAGISDERLCDWLPVIVERSDEFEAFAEGLNDEFSKATTLSVLLAQMTGNYKFIRAVERPYHTLYFNTGLFDLNQNETFVDCGASQGESISNLLRETGMKLAKSFEVEPDRYNVEKLKKVKSRFARFGLSEKIEIVPCAVGEAKGTVPFNHCGNHNGSVTAESTDFVEMQTVDDIASGFATLIKMDLEGYERNALRGAVRTIADCRPRLMISAYHKLDDLLEITKLVKSLRDDYRVGVQHHTSLRWDTCLYFY